MRKFILISLILSFANIELHAQQTPSTLRVKTDANGYLVVTGAIQTLPLSNPTVFSNTRLKTDSNGYLQVVLAGGTVSSPIFAPTEADCSVVAYSFTGRTTTGLNSHAANTWNLCAGGTLTLSGTTTSVNSALPIHVGSTPYASSDVTNWFTGGGSDNVAIFSRQTDNGEARLTVEAINGAPILQFINDRTDPAVGVPVLPINGTSIMDIRARGPINSGGSYNSAIPFLGISAAETWSSTTQGSRFRVVLATIGTTTTYDALNITSTIGTFIPPISAPMFRADVTIAAPSDSNITAGNNRYWYWLNSASNAYSGYLGYDSSNNVRFGSAGSYIFDSATSILKLGGTTSSFPSIKRNTTNLEARLADDSAYTRWVSGYVTAGSTPAVSNTTANSCGTTAATIAGNDNNGVITVGATAGTNCTITFVAAAPTRRECTSSNETTGNLSRTTYIDTTHSTVEGTFVAGDLISYVCFAR